MLQLSELRKRAHHLGASEEELDAAINRDDIRIAHIRLIRRKDKLEAKIHEEEKKIKDSLNTPAIPLSLQETLKDGVDDFQLSDISDKSASEHNQGSDSALGELVFYQVPSVYVENLKELDVQVSTPGRPVSDIEVPLRHPVKRVPWSSVRDGEQHSIPLGKGHRKCGFCALCKSLGLCVDKWYRLDGDLSSGVMQWERFHPKDEAMLTKAFWSKTKGKAGVLAEVGHNPTHAVCVASVSDAVPLLNEEAIASGWAKGDKGTKAIAGLSLDFWSHPIPDGQAASPCAGPKRKREEDEGMCPSVRRQCVKDSQSSTVVIRSGLQLQIINLLKRAMMINTNKGSGSYKDLVDRACKIAISSVFDSSLQKRIRAAAFKPHPATGTWRSNTPSIHRPALAEVIDFLEGEQ
jgi:hypothetical protein